MAAAIQTGPRGGRYYETSGGRRVYVRGDGGRGERHGIERLARVREKPRAHPATPAQEPAAAPAAEHPRRIGMSFKVGLGKELEDRGVDVYKFSGDKLDRMSEAIFGRVLKPEELEGSVEVPEGMTVRLRHVMALDRGGADADLGMNVHVSVHDAQGREVGELGRTFRRDPETGEPRMYLDLIKLDDDQQGTGAGKMMTRSMLEWARDRGAKQVDLSAEWVGKYYWASCGWNWDEETAGRMASGLEDYLVGAGVARAAASDTARRVGRRASDVAALTLGDRKIGKEFLSGKNVSDYRGPVGYDGAEGYHASLRFDDPVAMKTARARLGV
jgi:GNAT superfamily N-acetyltransferase